MLAVLAMFISFTVLNIGAIALAGHATTRPNPFSSFADVLPGQPRRAVVTREFSCAMGAYPILPDEYCTLDLAMGDFVQVGVVVSQGTVSRTDFTPREGTCTVGDLVLLWGIPVIQANQGRRVVEFSWPGNGVSASAFSDTGQFSLFLTVWSVSFHDTWT
jgi:hypothetical protein